MEVTVPVLQMKKLRLQREPVTISPWIRTQVCLTPEPLLKHSARPGRKEAGGSGGQGWMVGGGGRQCHPRPDQFLASVSHNRPNVLALAWEAPPLICLPCHPQPQPHRPHLLYHLSSLPTPQTHWPPFSGRHAPAPGPLHLLLPQLGSLCP